MTAMGYIHLGKVRARETPQSCSPIFVGLEVSKPPYMHNEDFSERILEQFLGIERALLPPQWSALVRP